MAAAMIPGFTPRTRSILGPTGIGTSGQVLTSDGAGGTSWATASSGVTDHGALTGLADDDHSIYALLAGRAGGQTLIGGTASGNSLTLQSTSHATKGDIVLGTASDVVASTGALRVGGAAADRIVLTASNASGNPEIQLFNAGTIDARITGEAVAGVGNRLKFSANIYVAGSIETTAAFASVNSLTAQSSGTTSPYLRVWDTGSSWVDLQIPDGTKKAHIKNTAGATIIEMGLESTTTLGFFGATSVAKPEVTGSHGSNAALQSLLSALASLGLITNSATA